MDNAKAQWVQMLAIVKEWFCGSYLFHGRSPPALVLILVVENTVYVDVQEMKNKRRKLSNDVFQPENVIHICLNEGEHSLF